MTSTPRSSTGNPWHALWAMMVGFFMILVDATIVAVANPSIMDQLDADYDAVIWVTSAYLLAYAVPLLLAGRLGDRFGPRNLYLVGLAVFTFASLGCGLAGSIGVLIAARVVQGLGAALLTPQTLSTITRLFPPERRGVAMSVWGATAGVATLVGPLAGGVLVDGLGWEWIFFVNVPIGIAGLVLAYRLVPVLPTEEHDFDVLGVLLSGVGMFLVVFALQEGESHDWAFWIWAMIAAGAFFMAGFLYWQSVNPGEPLIPLKIFRDNDFSWSNVGIAVIGFTVTAMVLPLLFFAQAVCGLSPTRSALLIAPMAIATGVLARFVGKLVDRMSPQPIVGFGFSMLAISLTWLSVEMTPTTPIWRLVLPIMGMGVGMAFIWAPLAATATRGLPPHLAGAGSGVYNATRQVGSVLGSAGIAAFMTTRISAEMPGGAEAMNPEGSVTQLPKFLHEPFSAALSQALLLPAFVALFGVVAALFLQGTGKAATRRNRPIEATVGGEPDQLETFTATLRNSASSRRAREERMESRAREERMDSRAPREAEIAAPPTRVDPRHFHDSHDYDDSDDYDFGDDDNDDYVEYTVDWDEPEPEPEPASARQAPAVAAVAPVAPEVLEAAYDAAYEVEHADEIAIALANALEVDGDIHGDVDVGVQGGAHHEGGGGAHREGGGGAHREGGGGAHREIDAEVHGIVFDEGVTEPLPVHVTPPLHAPAEAWHGGPAESWQHWVPEEEPPVEGRNGHAPRQQMLDEWFGGGATLRVEETDPIGFAHNGFRGKELRRAQVPPPPSSRGGRHSRGDGNGDDDAGTYGKHSMPHGD
jgi:EmrB/QacA subfamily drug resistance transporter